MKSPLRKRLPRELKSEFGKYLVVFIMMAITIGFVSGFLVADGSMLRAYDDSFQKYNIEDGYFQTKKKLTPAQKEDIEKSDVKVYENFYIEQKLTNGSTIRFFKNRKEVDKVCLMKGKMPKKSGEIAVDRMYADNNELKVGDTVKSRKKTFRITGLVALSDYSALFQNNNDTMFDAVKFGVAIVTDKDFEALNQVKVQYNYAWIYDKKPATEKKEKKMAEDLMEDMADVVTIESFVPQYQNQSIHFTGDDMGSDRAMIVMLLYIVMAILAFVFGITISNTIRKEAGVIGTLRASGYTLYGTSGCDHTDRGTGRKYSRIYSIKAGMCGDVLWKLQPSDICNGLECRSILDDNGCTGYYHAGDQLWDFTLQIKTVAA